MTAVAVTFQGDARDATAWSGTPAGIVRGLEELGVEVRTIRAAPPARWDARVRQALGLPRWDPRRARSEGWRAELARTTSASLNGLPYNALCSRLAQRDLAAAGHVDAVVQIGTSYRVEHPNLVTFEDLTIRQALGNPYFHWQHLDPRTVDARIVRQTDAYRRARAVCCATPWTAASVVGDYDIPSRKVHAVGVGTTHEMSAPDRDWSRPRFLFVGKDWEDKNGPVLLRAFADLLTTVPTATLDLVGHHPPVDQSGVTGHGFLSLSDPVAQEKLSELYAAATCLVVPTSFEPAGIVFLEAAAAGIPCIGTSRGGAADLIGPGGVTVDPADPLTLVAAMRHLCDPATAAAAGTAAAARVRLFTWPKVAERILAAAGLRSWPLDQGPFDGSAR
ncbi:hypothetical protein GCM10027053_10710 [Intrasporangium mesophilum]